MDSITSLISLLQYVRQLDIDLRDPKSTLKPAEADAVKKELLHLLTDAANDLVLVGFKITGKKIIGQDIPVSQDQIVTS